MTDLHITRTMEDDTQGQDILIRKTFSISYDKDLKGPIIYCKF